MRENSWTCFDELSPFVCLHLMAIISFYDLMDTAHKTIKFVKRLQSMYPSMADVIHCADSFTLYRSFCMVILTYDELGHDAKLVLSLINQAVNDKLRMYSLVGLVMDSRFIMPIEISFLHSLSRSCNNEKCGFIMHLIFKLISIYINEMNQSNLFNVTLVQ